MSAYVIFDVDVRDPARYQEFMTGVKPALEQAGAKYLARGGLHRVHEGDSEPGEWFLWNFLRSRRGRSSTMVPPIKD